MSTDITFEETYAAAREGEPTARAWLVERFDEELGKRLSRKAGRDVRRWNQTDDLRQSVWTKFFEKLPTYPSDLTESELKGYLFQIGRRCIADAAAQGGKQIGESKASIGEPLALMASTGEVTKADERRNLEEVISLLPEKLAVVVRLRRIEKMSIAEVAKKLDIAEATVKQRLAKGLRQLERILKRRRSENGEEE